MSKIDKVDVTDFDEKLTIRHPFMKFGGKTLIWGVDTISKKYRQSNFLLMLVHAYANIREPMGANSKAWMPNIKFVKLYKKLIRFTFICYISIILSKFADE